jgi:hypothetical protein
MRAIISVFLDDGTVVEGSVDLLAQSGGRKARFLPAPRESAGNTKGSARFEFDLDVRPFMKRYSAGRSGPHKLILLVSHFAKGLIGASVSRADVIDKWKRMTAIMGGPYNGAYDTRARDTGWLHSPKAGVFELRPGWEEVGK